ncbi:small subunit ribosomal protein S30e [Angomonas deanei]|nr:small subunit ribosomal protein S30e [Angomonas deanei]|eukprot:EPY34926.1 small subunit ribosomal protein S30e [Angomonas deanei]
MFLFFFRFPKFLLFSLHSFFLFFFSHEGNIEMGKVHGSLSRAGKVKNQTRVVAKAEKPKQPRGRALKRLKYTKRFLAKTLKPGEKVKMNKQPPGKAG